MIIRCFPAVKTRSIQFLKNCKYGLRASGILLQKDIEKNLSPINFCKKDIVQRTRGVCLRRSYVTQIYAGFSGHFDNVSNNSKCVNRKFEECPLWPFLGRPG